MNVIVIAINIAMNLEPIIVICANAYYTETYNSAKIFGIYSDSHVLLLSYRPQCYRQDAGLQDSGCPILHQYQL